MLNAGGVGALSQIAGEYLAYLGFLCAGFLLPAGLLTFLLERGTILLPEWEGMGADPFFALLSFLVITLVMFAAFQLFLFELADGIVNGILLQLICGVGMGYLAGYFYPSAFFPGRLRFVGGLLPAGAAARFVDCGFLMGNWRGEAAVVLAWTAAFLLLAAAVRQSRILRG